MRNVHYDCDNHCGATRVGGEAAPSDWETLFSPPSTWIFCSRRCLIEFLYKSKNSLSLGTQVKADVQGEVITGLVLRDA